MLENIPHLISKVENEEIHKDIQEKEIIRANWGLVLEKTLHPDYHLQDNSS